MAKTIKYFCDLCGTPVENQINLSQFVITTRIDDKDRLKKVNLYYDRQHERVMLYEVCNSCRSELVESVVNIIEEKKKNQPKPNA